VLTLNSFLQILQVGLERLPEGVHGSVGVVQPDLQTWVPIEQGQCDCGTTGERLDVADTGAQIDFETVNESVDKSSLAAHPGQRVDVEHGEDSG
jgi:hypothetical protein